MTGRPYSCADVDAEIVYTPEGRITWNAPLASEVVSSSAPDWIVTGIDTGAPEGFRTVPDKRNPCARGRSRANDAAWGTVMRARKTELPNDRVRYTSYVPGARGTG